MNFDFSDEQYQLKSSLRRFLEVECPSARVRTIIDGQEAYDAKLWKDLAYLGFVGAAIGGEFGGTELGYLELCLIAEELGRSLAPIPASSSIYLFSEFLKQAGTLDQKRFFLSKLAAGTLIGTFAYVEGMGEMVPERIEAEVSAGRLYGRKSIVADGGVADFAVVVAKKNGEVSLYIADLKDKQVMRGPLEPLDPSQNYATLEFDGVAVQPLGEPGEALSILSAVIDRASVLVAFEQIGGADRVLEMARDYALQRKAFGRAIGSFQAIKHMLADIYVAVTLARSNAYYAAWALSTNAPELPLASASARMSATQAFQLASSNNIQVHGGVGFTWEFDCHLFYRRSHALALSLGSLSYWEVELIRRMREHGTAQRNSHGL